MKTLAEGDIRESRTSIAKGAVLDTSFVVMNSFAAVIAAYGLLLNSVAIVIGAMIVAVLLGPIVGVALALVDGDDRLLGSSLIAVGIGTILVFGLAFTIGVVHSQLPLTPEVLARTSPNLMDLIVALAGGAAGAYATVSKKVSVGIVGAAIATALVPPLTASGICLAHGKPDLALGAFLLFFANLVAIQFAASIVLWAQGFHRISDYLLHPLKFIRRSLISSVLLMALWVGLGLNLRVTVSNQAYLNALREAVETQMERFPGVRVLEVSARARDGKNVVYAIVRSPFSFTPQSVRSVEAALPKRDRLPTELHLRAVLTKETSAEGYLHERAPSAHDPRDDQ